MSAITTHVLDASIGRPAAGVSVRLEKEIRAGEWKQIGQGATDADGRARQLLAPGAHMEEGTYRLSFDTGAYFRAQQVAAFYPRVEVVFHIRDASQPYHVPLLLSPYGYSTYRGS